MKESARITSLEHDNNSNQPSTSSQSVNIAEAGTSGTVPVKKKRLSLFSYNSLPEPAQPAVTEVANPTSATHSSSTSTVLTYIDFVGSRPSHASCTQADVIKHHSQFANLSKLFEYMFCTPATSAPVERVFSHSGIFMRPHRARLGDKLLSELVFCRCNEHMLL